ncbi:MAG TPA: ABC transporter permease [Gemmatimonadaceae bacterium]|nr:ABC transporter permease [Gemmatimonadaceae bacterium]
MFRRQEENEPQRPEPKWRRYLRLTRPNASADLDDELRDHLESTIEELVTGGMTPDAARAEALRRFGDVSRIRAQVRHLDAQHLARRNAFCALEAWLHDLRYAVRGLRRSVAFTFVGVVSIGLGVAANATVFSMVNALLLRPIPGTTAPGLVRMYVNHHSPFDWRDIAWFRQHARSFDYVFGERYNLASFRAAPAADDERIHISYVTRGFFPALGARTALGGTFDIDESTDAGASAVAMLSYAFWQRRFAGDSSVISQRVTVGGHPVTIVGVASPDFRSSVMSWVPDVFLPFSLAPVLTGRPLEDFGGSFYTTARLHPGTSPDAAQAELRSLLTQLARTDSARYDGMTVRLDHVRGVNAEARQAVVAGSAFLMVMVAMVLLIACANVANLQLGRAAKRRTEMGVRLAIGASRARLVRQLLTESLLLAAMGGVLGFAAAWMLTRLLPGVLPAEAGIDARYFAPDAKVAMFTAALCLLTTLVFGVAPALRAASPDVIGLLKGGDIRHGRRSRRGLLVIAQSALCVVLLAVASMFLRSLVSSSTVDPGFRAEGVIDATIDLALIPPGQDKTRTLEALADAASRIAGVQSASLAAVVPLGGSNMETSVLPEGVVVNSRRDNPHVYFNVVAPRFFATLETPIVRGREFLPSDGEHSARVAVINETAARRLWPKGDAVGKRAHWGSADGPLLEIVGIARDADYVMPGESPKPTVYVPLSQEPRSDMTLQVRTTADLASTRRALWALVREAAPTLPPPPVVRMVDDMAITLLPVRLGAGLLGAFGGLALILAAAGIYGVASYSVSSRTREIGIRAALGATKSRLIRMVLWENGRRVAIGGLIGLGVATAVAVGLSRVLYGVSPLDPAVLGGVGVVIGLVAIVAAFGPARRAAAADPVAAMRAE